MPSFKRRAFKNINVELGDNQELELPKDATDFFTSLIDILALIKLRQEALLLKYINNGKPKSMTRHILNDLVRR